MSGRKSHMKGKTGERELCTLLRDMLGIDVRRNLYQSSKGGHDILGVDGWAIECKRAKKYSSKWWSQTVGQAATVGLKPALCYRLDQRSWRVQMRLDHLCPSLTGWVEPLELSLPDWCMVVREQMSGDRGSCGAISLRLSA